MQQEAQQPDKAGLRQHMRALLGSLSPAERALASSAICARLVDLGLLQPELHRAGWPVAVYLAKPNEVNIDPFIEALLRHGIRVVAPRSVADDTVSFYSLRDLHSGPRPGRFGVRSPSEYSGGQSFAPRDLGIVLAPGLAFDRGGGRLGQGGGWYDRVLPSAKLSIGICFDCQLIDAVPHEEHDAGVDIIVTPSQTIEVTGRRFELLKPAGTKQQ